MESTEMELQQRSGPLVVGDAGTCTCTMRLGE